MIKSKKGILTALIIPIIALVFLAGYKEYILSIGKEVILPITGYDPRDLLSGYYLRYQINYGVKGICALNKNIQKKIGYVCLDPKMFVYHWPDNCRLMIKGVCDYSRFNAGIDRYYVSKEDAKRLEGLVRFNKASIVLSVSKNGKAQVKDLLINGRSWKDHLFLPSIK